MNAVGNLVRHVLPDGEANTFTYDNRNRLQTENFFDERTVSYSYTASGQRASVSDNRGTTGYVYDELDRLTRINQPDGVNYIAYGYDAAATAPR